MCFCFATVSKKSGVPPQPRRASSTHSSCPLFVAPFPLSRTPNYTPRPYGSRRPLQPYRQVSAFPLIYPAFSSSCLSCSFLKMHIKPAQIVLVAFALVARSTASSNAARGQCDSTPPTPLLGQVADGEPFALSSTLAVWSERLLSLLNHNGTDHPEGRLRAFADDLHLAFAAWRHAARPSYKPRKHHHDLGLLRRADAQKVTKCKVRSSGLGSSHGDNGSKPTSTTLPGMTPTDSNGRPLPTQTVGEGHGGSGRETIAITQPCGNIPVGASSKVFHITCGIVADRLSQSMYRRRLVLTARYLG